MWRTNSGFAGVGSTSSGCSAGSSHCELELGETAAPIEMRAPKRGSVSKRPSGPPGAASDLTDRVDELFAEWDHDDTPGCALGVMRDGELVYGRGYGLASLEHGVPIST